MDDITDSIKKLDGVTHASLIVPETSDKPLRLYIVTLDGSFACSFFKMFGRSSGGGCGTHRPSTTHYTFDLVSYPEKQ